MVTAMLSLALGKSVPADVAMTGEVTLTGKVLPVGGVKEKTLAAQRAGVRMVLLPLGNKRDWEELEEDVRRGIEAGFVDNYDQVFDVVFK
jgi:ATP-dependent Lon protease